MELFFQLFRLCLVHVKYFPENKAIFRKGKYFQVFGCISKNVLKNILWYLVVFLKITQKTHFLLVAHIFSAAKQIYNIIHQYKNTKETKPRKKIHQIWSYKNTKETKPRKKKFIKSRSEGEIERRWSRSLLDRCGAAIDETDAIQCDR